MEERLDHRSKLRLMSQFMAGVGTYIVARIAAILLPLFFVNQPGQARPTLPPACSRTRMHEPRARKQAATLGTPLRLASGPDANAL